VSYNYKDLNYIREALDVYEKHLCAIDINECDDDEAEELQDDILYAGRLKALTKRLIEEWEGKGPKLSIVDKKNRNKL